MSDISQWADEQISSRSITALVFFRGNWCPFCQGYMKELGGEFLENLRAINGDLIAITAQAESGAHAAKVDWQLGYEVVSDPSLELAKRYGIAITPKDEAPHPEEYETGVSQPGVIILDKAGKVLVSWAIDPAESNGHGALDRPLPPVLWAALQSALNGSDTVSLEGPRLDPEWLQANYPDAYKIFEEWMASQTSAEA
jgi:peroxiredoxin